MFGHSHTQGRSLRMQMTETLVFLLEAKDYLKLGERTEAILSKFPEECS